MILIHIIIFFFIILFYIIHSIIILIHLFSYYLFIIIILNILLSIQPKLISIYHSYIYYSLFISSVILYILLYLQFY